MMEVVLIMLGLVVLGLLGQAIEDYLKGEDELQIVLLALLGIMGLGLLILLIGWLI